MAGSISDSPDDFSLMQAIVRRESAALAALYARHSPLVLAICRKVLHDSNEADEVLTDIFYEVWAKADRFDSGRGSPVTYLVTLARSRAIDRKRSQATRPKITSDYTDAGAMSDPIPDPSEAIYLKERRVQVRQALSVLEPVQRQAVECSFYEGLSHSEIAQKLNRPLGTIKTYIRQGLIQMRQSLRNTQ